MMGDSALRTVLALVILVMVVAVSVGGEASHPAEISEASDPDETAAALTERAAAHISKGEYQKALPLLERALAIREKQLGPEHPLTATSLNNLAVLYYSMGEYQKALPLYQRALEIREKQLGPEHPETATSLTNLALAYKDLGEYQKALPLYQRALEIQEKQLGPEHLDTATSLTNLADVYASMGKYQKALPLYQRALVIARETGDQALEEIISNDIDDIRALEEPGPPAPTPTPEPTQVSILAAVDRELARLEKANIAFNTPDILQLGESATIQLLLSTQESIPEIQGQIDPPGPREGAEIRVSREMKARLTGPGFDIYPVTDEIQPVSGSENTEWRWEIIPKKPGVQRLHLSLSVLISLEGSERLRSIKTFERDIEVRVELGERISSFIANNWQWLWAVILVPVGAFLFPIVRKQFSKSFLKRR